MLTLSFAPPVPTSLTDIPPLTSQRFTILPSKDLQDIIANPLHAYAFQPTRKWENYNRRNLKLTVLGEYKLIGAHKVTPGAPFHEETTIVEGIVSTESETRSFATDIGVTVGIPKIGLGASISTKLGIDATSSVEISNQTSQTSILTASTTEPGGQLFWFWQYDVTYIVEGELSTWRLTSEGADALVADSRIVQTLDGEGRELKSGQQVPGAFRVPGFVSFNNKLQVNGQNTQVTTFPNGGGSAEISRPGG
jgi:hypothetical protein